MNEWKHTDSHLNEIAQRSQRHDIWIREREMEQSRYDCNRLKQGLDERKVVRKTLWESFDSDNYRTF